jgi:hypothetical protein
VTNYSCSSVAEFKPPYTDKPLVTITNGVNNPLTVAIGPKLSIWVGSEPDTITEYLPPYKKAPVVKISGNGLGRPFDIVFGP